MTQEPHPRNPPDFDEAEFEAKVAAGRRAWTARPAVGAREPDAPSDFGYSSRVERRSREWLRIDRGGTTYVVPREFTVRIAGAATGWTPVVVDVGVLDDGRPWCRRLTLEVAEAPGLTATALRAIAMKTLLAECLASVRERVEVTPGGSVQALPMDFRELGAFVREPGRRSRSVPDETLREVAAVYMANRRTPARAVYEHLNARAVKVSRPTSDRYIREAKRRVDPETGRPFIGSD